MRKYVKQFKNNLNININIINIIMNCDNSSQSSSLSSSSSSPSPSSSTNTHPEELKLLDVQINSQNDALNLLVSFLVLSQKRGTFTFSESAKILEAINHFQSASSK